MEAGRRAFLLPSRGPRDPWAQFCQRLSRLVAGTVNDESSAAGSQPVQQARLIAARAADIYHARALCAELDVVLVDAQAGLAAHAVPAGKSCLWVDGSRLGGIGKLDTRLGLISVEAGCRVAALQGGLMGSGWTAAGLAGVDPAQTVGHWLLTSDQYLPGQCAASGVHAVDVMLADGTSEQLGSFGHAATRPLGPALRALISGLFETAASTSVQTMRAQAHWPGRYRLDALLPDTPPGLTPIPNLAHLLLGSRGSLAWVERIHLRLQSDAAAVSPPPVPQGESLLPPSVHDVELAAVQRIDAYVKCRFDPDTRLPSPFV